MKPVYQRGLGIVLLGFCWLWLIISFTGTQKAFWNSLWVGIVLSGLSVLTGLREVRSVFGLLLLIPATVTFLLLLILKMG